MDNFQIVFVSHGKYKFKSMESSSQGFPKLVYNVRPFKNKGDIEKSINILCLSVCGEPHITSREGL